MDDAPMQRVEDLDALSDEGLAAVREALGEWVNEGMSEGGMDEFIKRQKRYFHARFVELARDTELDYNGAPGSGFSLNSGRGEDEYRARFFANFTVHDPRNPFTTHSMHLDHCVDGEGNVTCEINGVELDELGKRPGSYIGV